MQTGAFQANPLGRGQLADFLSGGCRTHSLRIDLDMLVVTASPARTALNNSQRTGGERRACFGDRTLWPNQRVYLQPQKFGERKKLLNVAQTLMSINGG